MKNRYKSASCLATLVMFVSGPAAHSTSLYWDLNGTLANTPAAITGAWNGTNTLWNTASTGTGGAVQATNTAADDLIFSSGTNSYTAGTVTASGTRVASSITFRDNIAVTLAGAISVGGTGTNKGIFVSSGADAATTVSGTITLTTPCTYQNNGAGLLTLSGGQTMATNALTINGSGATTISGLIGGTTATGTTSMTISGAGTTTLSNASNTFTGDIAINGGKLSYTGTTTTTASQLGRGSGTAYKQVLLSNGGIFQVASADFNVNVPTATNTAAGVVFNIAATGGTFDVAATRTFTIDDGTGTGTALTASQLQGSGALTKTGAGTLSLGNATASNAVFTGQININAGLLKLGSMAAAGVGLGATSAGTVIASGAAIDLNNSVSTSAEPLSITGTGLTGNVLFSSSTGASSHSGPITLAGSSSIGVNNSGSMTLSAGATIATAGNTLTINNTGTGRLFTDGVISGTGSLVMNSSTTGDYVPRAGHTYSGGSTLTSGYIAVDVDSVGIGAGTTSGGFGTGTVALGNIQLRSGTGTSRTIGNTLSLTGDPTFYTVPSEKTLVFAGPMTLVGGSRTLTSSVGTTVVGTSVIFNGDIGDGGGGFGITKAGAGNITFNGTNTYTGVTGINAGLLSIATTGSLPGWNTNGGFYVVNGATLAVQNGVNDGEIATMLATTNFDAGANLGFDTSAGNRTITANLTDTAQGQLGITKIGANTLTLTGTNTYTGNTNITAGSLAIASVGSLPGWDTNGRYSIPSGSSLIIPNAVTESNVTTMLGTTNIAAGATLTFDTSAGNRTYASAITNSAQGLLNLAKTGPNILTVTGANSYTGTTTVNNGTLVAAGGSLAAGNIIVGNSTDPATLNVPTGGTMTGGTITAGTVAGSFGAVNVKGGTLNLATQETTDNISFGAGEGGYGAFTMSSGTMTQSRLMFGGINGSVTGGTGVGHISGGTFNTNGWFILSRAGTSTGILTITGGAINHAGANNDLVIGLAGSGRAELNVAGGLIDNTGRRVTFSGGTGGTFHWSGTGLLNLNAGTLLTNSVVYDTNVASANASSYVNFNGGTLKAASASANFLAAFTPTGTGINQVLVNGPFGSFAGGAVIDTNGFDNTIAANLLAPSGTGVTSLTVTSPGSGYIGAPAVKILNADTTPSTATGYAVVDTDPTSGTYGQVTNVFVTNPGDVIGTPTVSLIGGGGTGAAVTATTGANTSGGLTKTGVGTLTLTGANTYTGTTSVTGGSLTVPVASAVNTTTGLSVGNGARFNYLPAVPDTLSLSSASLTLANNSNLGVAFGSTIAAGGAASVAGQVNLILSGSFVSGTPYTVLTATSGLDAGSYNVLNRTDYTYTTTVTPTSVQITPTSVTPLTTAYWLGGLAGGAGIWGASNGTTSSNWTTDGAGTATSLVPGAATDVFFSDASALPGNQLNMTLGADMAVNSLTFNSPNDVSLLNTGNPTLTIGSTTGSGLTVNPSSGNVTLNSNIAVGNAQTWTNATANPLTLGGVVSNGANLLTIAGSGATNFASFNGGTGGLTVSAGTTTIASAALAGAQTWTNNTANTLSAATIGNGGFALTLAGTGDFALSGVVSGGGALIKGGSGTAIVSGINTYTGATTVNEGTLTITGARTGASGAFNVGTVAGLNATLNITTGTYALGGNAMNVGNQATTAATGTVNQSGGAISFTSGNAVLVGQNTVGNQGIYNLSGGSITTFASTTRGIMLGVNSNPAPGPTSGGGTFNLSGTGVINMTAASGGGGNALLEIGRSDAVANNTTNLFNQTGGTANVGILTMGGAATSGSTGVNSTLTLTGGVFSANSFTLLSAGGSNTSTINIGGTADVTLPAFPTARGASSTATLNIDGGTIRPAAASTTYISGLTNAFIKAGGAKFDVPTGRNITVAQALLTDPVSTGGGLTKEGVGALSLSGANTYSGNTLISAGTLQLGAATTTGSLALTSTITNNGTFAVSRTNAAAQGTDFSASPITGTGGFNQAGAGTTTLTAANSFTGPTTISAGVLSVATIANIGVASPLGAGDSTDAATNTASLVFNGGTLAYSSATGATNRGFTMTGAGTFSFPAGNNNAFTFAGNVTGTGTFNLNGAANTGLQNLLTLTGDNSNFTGNVTVTVGGIRIINSNGLGTGSKTITLTNGTAGNPNIQIDGTAGDIALPPFTYTVSNQTNNGCLVNIAGNNTVDGQINVTSGGGGVMATSIAGNMTISANITAIATGRAAFFQGASNGTVSGIISDGSSVGTFFVQKSGAGTWTLSGANTYTGATTVGEGSLSVSSLNSVTGGTASSSLGAPTTVANGTIALGGGTVLTATPASTGTLVYTGTGETTDRVIKLAGGTGGGVIDQAGTGLLKFTSDLSAPGAAATDQAKTLTLKGSTAGSGEISGKIVDSTLGNTGQLATSLAKEGTGTWTLSGANTYTGNTTVNGGTLSLTSAYLADTSSVSVASGAALHLDYIGTDVVTSLTLGGVVQPNGIYDSSNSGGRITGTGKIQVGSYAIWAAANGIPGEPPSGDFDQDGITNLMEYALGLNPTVSNGSPGTFTAGVLSFTKGAQAFGSGDVSYEIEESTGLAGWVVVVPNAPASPTISYTLPTGKPKEFARLKVTQIP